MNVSPVWSGRLVCLTLVAGALFAVADTPEKMLALGEDKVRDYIKTIGLYRNKAKNVIALSQKLVDEFGQPWQLRALVDATN